jgi:hypothetical protein
VRQQQQQQQKQQQQQSEKLCQHQEGEMRQQV